MIIRRERYATPKSRWKSRCRQAEAGKAGLVITLHQPRATIQVSSEVFNAGNSVKSFYLPAFMQRLMTSIRQERDELVRVEPRSITKFPNFEGTIYGMQVELDTVKYAEISMPQWNINATMNECIAKSWFRYKLFIINWTSVFQSFSMDPRVHRNSNLPL